MFLILTDFLLLLILFSESCGRGIIESSNPLEPSSSNSMAKMLSIEDLYNSATTVGYQHFGYPSYMNPYQGFPLGFLNSFGPPSSAYQGMKPSLCLTNFRLFRRKMCEFTAYNNGVWDHYSGNAFFERSLHRFICPS